MNHPNINSQFIQACIKRQQTKLSKAKFRKSISSFFHNILCGSIIFAAVVPVTFIGLKSCADDVDRQEMAAYEHQDRMNIHK